MNPQGPEQQSYQPPTPPEQPTVTPPQPPVPPAPAGQPVAPQAPQVVEAPGKSHKKLALWLIIGPSALFVVAIGLSLLSALFFNNAQPTDGEMFAPVSPVQTIFNLFFFLSMLVSIVTWLPGLIIGIVLLAKQSK